MFIDSYSSLNPASYNLLGKQSQCTWSIFSFQNRKTKSDLKFELLLLFQVLHGAHVVLLFAFLDLPGGLYFLLPEKDIALSHIEESCVT